MVFKKTISNKSLLETSRVKPAKKRSNIISAARGKSARPVSVRLGVDIHVALEKLKESKNGRAGILKKMSLADVIRQAINQFLANDGLIDIPPSIGVVDDVYAPTIHHDVVELANQLRLLEFGLLRLSDNLAPSPSVQEVRAQLRDASRSLSKIAGQISMKSH